MIFGVKDQTDEILRRHLDRDFNCVAGLDDAPTKHQLREVARKYGCKLPKDFVAHSTGKLGSIYIEVKEELWPRPKAYDVGPFWSFLYAIFVYGLSPKAPQWMNLDLAAAEFLEATGHSLIPCLKRVSDPDIYLFDTRGEIVRWSHEGDELRPFDGSFFKLLDLELGELRERKNHKVGQS